jgi:hypothetical protein
MAETYPSLDTIGNLKVTPTDGELFLLKYLIKNLSDDYEVYFQPFLNGDMPDIILMRRDHGVIILEVKDWLLENYNIDYQNAWHLNKNDQFIKSPFQQAFGYKSNMFDLHISGLAEKNVLNKCVYNIIKPYVYFHTACQADIKKKYRLAEDQLKIEIDGNNQNFKNKQVEFEKYENKRIYLEQKVKQIQRDKGMSLVQENLDKKIIKELTSINKLFTDDIYFEFRRYLKPPMHVAEQGKDIKYGTKQLRLTESKAKSFQKIKGVAGSGKTTVLAKRAVNAHKRHGDKVLILTYNKTLRNYIRDKISDVRDSFSWNAFAILNYHSFIASQLNSCGIAVAPPEDCPLSKVSEYLNELYSNINLFESHKSSISKFKTILVDEIQDYQSEWIEIVKKYFLDTDGEMLLFGDESQNIYKRDLDSDKSIKIIGFGTWERLTKSYRAKRESSLLLMFNDFQKTYLLPKYDVDSIESEPTQLFLEFDIIRGFELFNKAEQQNDFICNNIMKIIKEKEIHPNDISILSGNIKTLRAIDKQLREFSNEETMTTFEKDEVYQELKAKITKFVTERSNCERIKNNADKAKCIHLVKMEIERKLEYELKNLRDSKKFSFEQNSGHMKLSTTHSFKGIESAFVIYIANEHDSAELTYTSITRSKRNLVIFIEKDNQYFDFFNNHNSIKFNKIPLTSNI